MLGKIVINYSIQFHSMSSEDLKKMMASMTMSNQKIETFFSIPRMARMASISESIYGLSAGRGPNWGRLTSRY